MYSILFYCDVLFRTTLTDTLLASRRSGQHYGNDINSSISIFFFLVYLHGVPPKKICSYPAVLISHYSLFRNKTLYRVGGRVVKKLLGVIFIGIINGSFLTSSCSYRSCTQGMPLSKVSNSQITYTEKLTSNTPACLRARVNALTQTIVREIA